MGLRFHGDTITVVSVYRESVPESVLKSLENVWVVFTLISDLEEHLYPTSVDDIGGDVEDMSALSEFCEEIRKAYPTASYFRIITQ